ncbi:LPS export ABC transporter permease LptF [Vineibacter terrae]|uniref:LPS export ABC transporter permease LptF n=1 Tax=Vineibacter terrae TaxID=2586908 RepID=UPI002E32078F|nr:LPS export ABC transporter permease LptF [Vineibacter terrae]HEX2888388.1 LPS export ABC transporter permease LptF [Vineibacter terrae]
MSLAQHGSVSWRFGIARIDRYILERALVPLTASIGIALVALLLERMVRLMELMVNQGSPVLLVLKLLANLVPHYLGLALPLALFLGITLSATRLSVDSELDALQSAGVGLTRLLRPVVWLTLVLTAVMVLLVGWLQPLTRYQFRALMWAATNSAWDLAVEKGSFFNGIGNYTVLIEDIGDNGRTLKGVFVQQRKSDGGTVMMTAETGEAGRLPESGQIVLKLRNGRRVETERASDKVTVLSFERFDLPMEVAATDPFRDRSGERELTFTEMVCQLRLQPVADAPPSPPPWPCSAEATPLQFKGNRLQSEMHARLVRVLSLVFLPLMSIPLGLASRRSQKGAGLVVGVILLTFFNYLLQFGEKAADYGKLSPWIGLWGPWAAMMVLSFFLFWLVKERPRDNPVETMFEALERLRGNIIGSIRRTFSRA